MRSAFIPIVPSSPPVLGSTESAISLSCLFMINLRLLSAASHLSLCSMSRTPLYTALTLNFSANIPHTVFTPHALISARKTEKRFAAIGQKW